MTAKRVFFFKGGDFVLYDARNDIVDAAHYPTAIGPDWSGLTAQGFDSNVDAVLNAGNGFIYLFKQDQYVKYDPRHNHVHTGARQISEGWTGLADTGFERDLDAAVLYTDDKVLFFKGNRYLRYKVSNDTVDPGYPKYISAGWSNMFAPFTDGIDAAVNWGNGVAYFFKGPQYVRVTIASNAVDAGYPLDIAPNWPALPSAFASGISDVVEWPYCEVVGFNKQVDPQIHEEVVCSTVLGQLNRVYQLVAVVAQLASAPHPALCAAGEYRQYVRGVQIVGGVQVSLALGIKPRPADGDPNADFVEDSLPSAGAHANPHYGHRDELPGNVDRTDHSTSLTGRRAASTRGTTTPSSPAQSRWRTRWTSTSRL